MYICMYIYIYTLNPVKRLNPPRFRVSRLEEPGPARRPKADRLFFFFFWCLFFFVLVLGFRNFSGGVLQDVKLTFVRVCFC